MPAKKSSKAKSNTRSRTSKTANKNKSNGKIAIAMGVLLVAVIAVAGVVWYRQSQASAGGARVVGYWNTSVAGGLTTRSGYTDGFTAANCSRNCQFLVGGSFNNGTKKWVSGRSTCQIVTRRGSKGGASQNLNLRVGDPITIFWTDGCW